MKKVKGKYIRITEEQLNRIIEETVNKKISIWSDYILPRNKFIDNVAALSKQIIENWCLLRYCSITKLDINQNKKVWKRDLLYYMSNIGQDSIKGDKSYDVKFKAIVEGFEYKDLFDGADRICDIISLKFMNEGIDLESQEVKAVCEDCSNTLKEIINQMAAYSMKHLFKYVSEI